MSQLSRSETWRIIKVCKVLLFFDDRKIGVSAQPEGDKSLMISCSCCVAHVVFGHPVDILDFGFGHCSSPAAKLFVKLDSENF